MDSDSDLNPDWRFLWFRSHLYYFSFYYHVKNIQTHLAASCRVHSGDQLVGLIWPFLGRICKDQVGLISSTQEGGNPPIGEKKKYPAPGAFWGQLDSNVDSDSKQLDPDSDLDSRKMGWVRIQLDSDLGCLDSDSRYRDSHITGPNVPFSGKIFWPFYPVLGTPNVRPHPVIATIGRIGTGLSSLGFDLKI